MSGNNGCPNDENAYERMVRQSRALAGSPCEHEGEPCYGCATCFARETVRALDDPGAKVGDVCVKCRSPHDGSQWQACEYCSVARTKAIAGLQANLRAALTVNESFRPLAHAAKEIAVDGWPDFPKRGYLPASLEARLDTLRAAYEGIADMVSDADAEACA